MKVIMVSIWIGLFSSPLPPSEPQKELAPNTLPERAERLKAQGLHQAEPETIMPMYRALNSYEEVTASADLVVLANCDNLLFRLHRNLSSIETIYKFSLHEILSGQLSRQELLRGSPEWKLPGGLQPLAPLRPNQILVSRAGGRLIVNGVLFRESVHDFPPFEVGKRYVLFLDRVLTDERLDSDYQGRPELPFYTPVAGPFGCVEVVSGRDQGGQSIRSMVGPFNESLGSRFQGHLPNFLQFIREEGARKPLR